MTQKMCDKAVDAYLSVLKLKFVPDWLVVTEILDNVISLMMIHTLMIYFLILLHPLAMIWVLLLQILIVLTFDNFDEDDPRVTVLLGLMTWHNRLKNMKHV